MRSQSSRACHEKLAGTSRPACRSTAAVSSIRQLGKPRAAAGACCRSLRGKSYGVGADCGLSAEFRDGLQELRQQLATAGAHKTRQRARRLGAVRSSGEDRVFPVTWRCAWNWARMRRTSTLSSRARNSLHIAERSGGSSRASPAVYSRRSRKGRVLSTKRNATQSSATALAGLCDGHSQKSVRAAGPNATRYRRDARKRCWMPTAPCRAGS